MTSTDGGKDQIAWGVLATARDGEPPVPRGWTSSPTEGAQVDYGDGVRGD